MPSPRKTAAKTAAKTALPAKKAATRATSTGAVASKAPAKKTTPKPATIDVKQKTPRKTTAANGKLPSAELAAVIGAAAVARTEVIKKLWGYIKANGLQDAANKRAINADAKLLPVFGKPQVTMFELAGIVGKHLS